MFTDTKESRNSEVVARRASLRERISNLMRNPESIRRNQDILSVDRYENFLAVCFYSPLVGRRYQVVPLGCSLSEESRYLLFCYERNWEHSGYNESAPVIETKDGRQIECGILDLGSLGDSEREEMESGFNEVQSEYSRQNQMHSI